MHRFTVFLVALVATTLLATGLVVAADPPPTGLGARLAADGAGQIQIDGNVMIAFGLVGGRNGSITVTDRGGDAKVTFNGQEISHPHSRARQGPRDADQRGQWAFPHQRIAHPAAGPRRSGQPVDRRGRIGPPAG